MTENAAADSRDGLPSQYRPAEVEDRLYRRWQAAGYFEANANSGLWLALTGRQLITEVITTTQARVQKAEAEIIRITRALEALPQP